MVELSNERIEQILHEETAKKEDLDTILRSIYIRYMRLYEKYFADIDALNDEKIEAFRKYHEETQSLVRYYHMDIPQDICEAIKVFEKKYSTPLLGKDWHGVLYNCFDAFADSKANRDKGKEELKEAFTEEVMADFYNAMDYVFRDGFKTASQTAQNIVSEITGFFFGKGKGE